jgi:hypothetical protein
MQQVDQAMMPRKANKEETAPQPISEFLKLSKKEKERSAEKNLSENFDKEAWLEQQAKKYQMTSDQIRDVFYYCSNVMAFCPSNYTIIGYLILSHISKCCKLGKMVFCL